MSLRRTVSSKQSFRFIIQDTEKLMRDFELKYGADPQPAREAYLLAIGDLVLELAKIEYERMRN